MLDRATKRIFLCDESKLGTRTAHLLCALDEIDEVVCNIPLPKEFTK